MSELATAKPDQPLSMVCVPMLPSDVMKPMLAEYVERRKTFREWLLGQLRVGVHFGVPPGCEPKMNGAGQPIDDSGRVISPERWTFKPSLYKAGADFICDLLQMDPQFGPDLDTWKMLGSKDGTIVLRCVLISRAENPFFRRKAGEILGEGRGAGVAGVKRRDANGAVKIAQKSAKIDAVINALGLSDLFTQDLEDQIPRSPTPDPDASSPKVSTRAQRAPSVAAELNTLFNRWKAKIKPDGTLPQFADWAGGILDTELDLSKTTSWTIDAIQKCDQEIE